MTYSFAYPGVVTSTVDYGTIPMGSFAVEDNCWGTNAGGVSGSQDVFTEMSGGIPAFGWTWNWSTPNSSVVTYPEVGFGFSPNGNNSWGSPSALPIQVSSIYALTSDFSITSTHSGSGYWDMAYDIWITTPSMTPTPGDIKYEIMIWLDHSGQSPAGTLQTTETVGGISYNVWKSSNVGGHIYIAYVMQSPLYNGSVNIAAILNDLTANWGVPSSDYLASIEFGNEVMGGSGTTTITSWSITIQNQ